jgi:2,5-diamino-6-(ribosylamino)-4(3H)-pyrimidinone 5'-phosphate reductase
MLPKIIVHNAISVDSAIKGFPLDLEKYYGITGQYNPGAMLVGSNTARTGIELYGGGTPEEMESDFIKPRITEEDARPYWVIPDSRGALQGMLHVFRRFPYCKDVVVLLTEQTPEAYVKYLLERNYEIIIAGDEHVDFRSALETLHQRYSVSIVLTDSGGNLNSILLKEGLVDEISLIITPYLVDSSNPKLFRELNIPDQTIALELVKTEALDDDQLLVLYKVKR